MDRSNGKGTKKERDLQHEGKMKEPQLKEKETDFIHSRAPKKNRLKQRLQHQDALNISLLLQEPELSFSPDVFNTF